MSNNRMGFQLHDIFVVNPFLVVVVVVFSLYCLIIYDVLGRQREGSKISRRKSSHM